ncbi:MAG: tRNA 2-thiocytidine biosynthesis TtcA family protein [Desulfonauticus sp.]|nr:tRNA 2-thiocytidine biosynthesis TtcA family protein [Desulfonauticus sp.]
MKYLKKMTYAQKQVVGLCGKLMQSQDMLFPGARVGIALSGGVDSWTLLQVLIIRQKIVPFSFELMILHLNPGFDPNNHQPLLKWLDKNPMSAHVEITDFGPKAHSEQNKKKSACFLCAWNRRKRLFELCAQYHLTHLAFGHVLDDLVTNFFLNLIYNGKVEGMSPKESFFKGKLLVIRPLLAVEKKIIQSAAKQWKLPVWENPCPSAQNTNRTFLTQSISALAPNPRLLKNIFRGIRKWQLDF